MNVLKSVSHGLVSCYYAVGTLSQNKKKDERSPAKPLRERKKKTTTQKTKMMF